MFRNSGFVQFFVIYGSQENNCLLYQMLLSYHTRLFTSLFILLHYCWEHPILIMLYTAADSKIKS